jgi:hypothetical protein
MSLDVYLTLPGVQSRTGSAIFIREDGQNKEITRAEWDARFPGREPVIVSFDDDSDSGEVYSANITHNLGKMAREAGIYEALWRPEEIGITHTAQLIAPLNEGLALLKSNPERFTRLNPENGWGTYEGLVRFVADYLAACEAYPASEVSVWR